MKYYNLTNNYNFITDDFNDLLEFSNLRGKDLIEKCNNSLSNVKTYIDKKNIKNKITNFSYFKDNRNRNLFRFSVHDNTSLWQKYDQYKKISHSHKKGYNEINSYSTTFTPESEFKNISTNGNYLFFHLSKHFILDNLSRTLTDTDLNAFKKFSKSFLDDKKQTLNSTSKLIEKYDELYPRLLKYMGTNTHKPSHMMKWRADFDVDFFMSLHHYGFFNPIIHDDTDKFLWNGTHRAAYGASLGYDVPNTIHYSENEKLDGKFYRVSPSLFNGQFGLFEFDLNEQLISVIFIKKNELDFLREVDDGCDIQGFYTSGTKEKIEEIFKEKDISCILNYNNFVKKYNINYVRYFDDSIKSELKNFKIYNDFQILNILNNRNKNLYEISKISEPWEYIGEYGVPVSITYPKQRDRNFYKGNYLYIEIPYGVYVDFIHGWTDDVCTKYHFNKENNKCNCYNCNPENESHMTLSEVRNYIRSSKKWKNKKNTNSSSYETFLSIKYLGLHRPVMNFKTFLKRGVHRSLFLSETQSDVPNLFKLSDSDTNVHRIVSEKPYYNLKKFLILEIKINEKELTIFSSKDKKTKEKLLTKISYK